MNTEQKAKAYDEAVNKIKSLYEQAKRDGNPIWSTYEYLVPELSESEDERIRTELLSSFKGIMADADEDELWYGLPYNDIIAWLEKQEKEADERLERVEQFRKEVQELGEEIASLRKKIYGDEQKEQKPIKWTDLTWKDIVELEGIINNVHYEFRNGIGQESFGKEVLERFRESKGDDYVDEQKPAIKLVFPKFRVGDIIRNVRDKWDKMTKRISYVDEHGYIFDYGHLGDKAGGGSFGFCFEDDYELVEQKPAEWSEGDENMLWNIISIVGESKSIQADEMLDWLKSLRPQPKQEWSEEDETMWSNLIWYLEGKVGMLPSGKERYIKWLKERFVKLVYPKSGWKPSEEQMDSLERASTNKYLSAEQYDILDSLQQEQQEVDTEEEDDNKCPICGCALDAAGCCGYCGYGRR